MGIELPNARSVFLPIVPEIFHDFDEVRDYLKGLRIDVEGGIRKTFDNISHVVSTGTSGSFVDSAGNTITVTNGIITSLS